MAESNTTFERRFGIDSDHGVSFEWQTTNLAYLRCEKFYRQWVQDNTLGVKSYFVANNVDGIGAFDDVVIRAEYSHQNEDKIKLIFVQCKHSANPKKCMLEHLFKCGTVQKYFDSFIEVLRILNDHRALSCQTYKEIEIRKKTKRQRTQEMDTNTEKEQKLRNLFQCKPHDCEFILYCNMILDAGFENTQTQQDNDVSMKILNTARSNEFNISLNAKQLEYLLNEQFVDSRKIFEELKQEFATKFRIFVNQVENDNYELLKSIIPTADIGSISPLLDEEVKLMFQNDPCTAITQNSELLENIENFSKLKTIAKNEMESFLRIPEHTGLFSNESIENLQKQFEDEAQTKIYTSSIELEKLKLKQFVTNGVKERKLLVFIKDKNDFSIWTKARKSRLYRNLDHIFVCLENTYMLSGCIKDTNEVFIEIHQNNDNDSSFDFAQFSDETSNLILNHAITFQGFTVTINEICGDRWCRFLDEKTICRILRREEITIGTKFFDPLDCYIERMLQLEEISDENSYKVNQQQIMDKNGKKDIKILTEDEIIVSENKKVFLLTGPAGIGKSTTLKSLALKYKNKNPKYFVYLVELNKYLNVLKKYEENCDVAGAFEFLAQKILSLQQLEYRLFVYACAENKNVALFFDAFDEISPDGEQKFSSFLETLLKAHVSSIFVSSRPNFIGTLEKKIKQKSLIFVPFTFGDKKLFFLQYYEKLTKQNATTNDKEEMENVISTIIKFMEEEREQFNESLEIPLQISMLAEIHFEMISEMTTEEKMSFSFNMDICSLYNAFIEKLVVRYLVEKKKLNLLNMQDAHRAIEIKNTMRDAEELACKLLCPDINQTPLSEYSDAIIKMCNQVGLITNIDPPIFLHRTYGEFLAASFFVKSIMNENKNSSADVSFMCKNVLIEDEYAQIRRFINAILCNLNSRENDSYIMIPVVKLLVDEDCDKTSLHVAAKEKHAEILKLLVQNDHSKINEIDENGYTAVELACLSGCLKSVEILYLNNCLTNVKNVDRETVLHCAVMGSNTDIINFILEKDKSFLTKTNYEGNTAFSVACKDDNIEAVMCFLKIDNDLVNIVDECGNLPLHYAAKNGIIQIVKEILSHKSNLINIKSNDGLFPLHIACKNNNIEVAKYLLTQKSSVVSMKCGEKEETSLHFASRNGNVELMTLLLQHDQTLLNKRNSDEESPLLCALFQKQTEAAKFLLKFSNCVVNEGENPLTFAAGIGDVEFMKDLLQHDQTLLNKCNLDEESPLLCALRKRQTEAAKFLLTFRNCVVNEGENPLTFAAGIGDVELMKDLLQLDQTLLNKCNLDEKSPLLCALRKRQTEAAKFLLTFFNCVVNEGENPLTFAAGIGDVELMKDLLQLDQTLLNKCNLDMKSPLLCALFQKQTEAAKFLLKFSNCVVNEGENPLIFAAIIGDVELMTLILERDQSLINKCNLKGETPLFCALSYKNTTAAKFLLTFPNCPVGTGENPLNLAAEIGDVDILRKIHSLDCTLINKVGENCYKRHTPLICALKASNIEAAKFLLELPECSITVDTTKNSPFHYAAMEGYVEIINLLLNKDRSLLLKQNISEKTALGYAIDFWNPEVARILLSCDEYIVEGNILQNDLKCALKLERSFEIMTMMLERNPTLINMRNSKELLPLDIACEYNNTEAVKYLLPRTDSTLILKGEKNDSILHTAAKNGNLIIIKYIMEKFPTLFNQQDSHGCTALHCACKYNNTEVAKLLLNHINCQVDVYNDKQQNSLHFSSKRCNLELMMMILNRDISLLNIQNKKGQTPLHLTLLYGSKFNYSKRIEMVEASKYLLSLNCSVNVKDVDEKTPLHLASDNSYVEIVELLIERDETLLNLQDKDGCTPLYCALRSYDDEFYSKECIEIVSFLLNFPECDINRADNDGDTPLHHVAGNLYKDNRDEILSLLLQRDGLLINVKNNVGVTALHYAAGTCYYDELKILLSHKECKANVQDRDGDTPLHWCIRSWMDAGPIMRTIIYLIKHDSSLLHIKNHKGQTPLQKAVELHEFIVADLLVRLGADVNIKDNDNRTPLESARQDDDKKRDNRKIIETHCLQSAGTATTEPPSGLEEIE